VDGIDERCTSSVSRNVVGTHAFWSSRRNTPKMHSGDIASCKTVFDYAKFIGCVNSADAKEL
jgi:hypothetical protein